MRRLARTIRALTLTLTPTLTKATCENYRAPSGDASFHGQYQATLPLPLPLPPYPNPPTPTPYPNPLLPLSLPLPLPLPLTLPLHLHLHLPLHPPLALPLARTRRSVRRETTSTTRTIPANVSCGRTALHSVSLLPPYCAPLPLACHAPLPCSTSLDTCHIPYRAPPCRDPPSCHTQSPVQRLQAGRRGRVSRVTHRAAASAVDRVHVWSDGSGQGNRNLNHNPSPKV